MLAPGMTISSSRVVTTASASQVADYVNQGVGFMNDGSVALDLSTPAGTSYKAGIRVNASGALYATTTADAGDVWNEGLRVSAAGALVVEVANAASYQNGNPITANGRLAVSDAT